MQTGRQPDEPDARAGRDADAGALRPVSRQREQEEEDSSGFLSFGTPLLLDAGRQTRHLLPNELPLPDLELPAPSIPAPIPSSSVLPRPRVRIDAAVDSDERIAILTSPRLTSSSPRTRFNLSGGASPRSRGLLRPILQSPSTPIAFTPSPDETDIADSKNLDFSPPNTPAFAPREDDEPHPERIATETRVPHPLYTPTPEPGRRRRRKASRSVASGKTMRSTKSRVKAVWRHVRRRRARGPNSTGSGTGSINSTDTSTNGSSHSSSTWAGWRFWRNSSSGGSSSGDEGEEDEWVPPAPNFTLLTPTLAGSTPLPYPARLVPGASSTSLTPTVRVFDLLTTSTIGPSLERLQEFWTERRQEDGTSGDLGTGTAAPSGASDNIGGEPSTSTSTSTYAPTRTPPVISRPTTPGSPAVAEDTPILAAAKKLRGEARGARAEERRLGKGAGEDGPAWWLDVMCPTVADMKEIRKILPLHPLTMEDILHQETREKVESFPALGYYFTVFRALDESYFRYTSPDAVDPLGEEAIRQNSSNHSSGKIPDIRSGRRGRLDIVEGVGGKEGVEGVGVGAVNLYLVVFADGILSFHFEDISKHIEQVQAKIQQLGGQQRAMSSHWIAYGLMDSVVDAFFPLIHYIEAESTDVNNFLIDPHQAMGQRSVGQVVNPDIYDRQTKTGTDSDRMGSKDEYNSSSSSSLKRRPPPLRKASSLLRYLPTLSTPSLITRRLPSSWVKSETAKEPVDEILLVDASGFRMAPLSGSPAVDAHNIGTATRAEQFATHINNSGFDRQTMLKRIANARKLVTGLNRLLGSKTDVVRGLRKRTQDSSRVFGKADSAQDISIYFGDLFDHIVSMQQTLHFYDTILAHDHPAFIETLHISLKSAKAALDHSLMRLYTVTLTFIATNVITGIFSLNVPHPQPGARFTYLDDNGNLEGYAVFGAVVATTIVVLAGINGLVYYIYISTVHQRKSAIAVERNRLLASVVVYENQVEENGGEEPDESREREREAERELEREWEIEEVQELDKEEEDGKKDEDADDEDWKER